MEKIIYGALYKLKHSITGLILYKVNNNASLPKNLVYEIGSIFMLLEQSRDWESFYVILAPDGKIYEISKERLIKQMEMLNEEC